jgi:opacity protein-like surface antigen
MIGGAKDNHSAGVALNGSTCNVKMKTPILGATVLVLTLLPASVAKAQCTTVGLDGLSKAAPVVAQAAGMAVANVSASVGALVTSINSANTAFLTQSSAFIGSPANPQPDQQGGGVWVRGVVGHLDANTTATAGNIKFDTPQLGNINCNTHTLADFAGVQLGTDVARLNINGWNLHAGLTTGYLGSRTQDATPGLDPPASFRDTLQIPFVGAYGAASYGGFLVDGQVRGDFFENEVSDNNHGLSGQRFDARGVSLTGNVAYNQNLGNQWFIEPSAGITWSRTHVDPLNVPGTGILGIPVGPGFVPPWVLTVNDIESTLGRLSVRVGTSVASGNVVLQPFVSASVFHEFQGTVASNLTSNFSAMGVSLPTLSSTVSAGGLGTYGQFGLGLAAQVVNTGWVSYLRGDYRKGDNIEGWSLNGGLRYQFAPDTVVAAAIAKAPVYKTAQATAAYNWTGFYVGANAGAAWGFTNWNFPDEGAAINPRFAGFLGGGDLGYNYQVGKWVFGLEGDASWTNAHGTRPCPTDFFHNCEVDINWLSTVTGRVGYAWDRLLIYAKGGAVIAQGQAQSICNTNSRPTIIPLTGCPSQNDSKTAAGWTAGLGYEFGLTRNLSARGEIMYFDLGSDDRNLAGIPTDLQRSGFISTVGLHYRFGG